MKLVEGRTLEEAIGDLHAADFDPALLDGILRVLLKVCEAVSFAHSRDVVHCDLKPANVMIGSHGQVYVMDWGVGVVLANRRTLRGASGDAEMLARVTTSGSTRGQAPSLAGTVSYMSPEQATGDVRAIGPHTDVFALGATLYHVLTGHAPYSTEKMSRALAQARKGQVEPPQEASERPLPPALCEIAGRALRHDPEDRYPGVDEFRADLEAFLLGGGWFATRSYAPGEDIVREGDVADAAYVIVQGRCEVTREVDGERRSLRTLGVGDVFGEMALLAESRRTASVSAVDEVTVKLITADAFERELDRSSLVAAIVKQLTARFLELERSSQP
jgi:serine/threonine-protein kinase